jgi:uncharacterized membrane protein
METLMSVLHVATAVFIVGPMALLPHTALRAVRLGDGRQVASLSRSTFIFGVASVLVVVFGFGAMALADKRFNLSITTPWILISLILWVVAAALTLLLVVPWLRAAADGGGEGKPSGYGRIAAVSGIVTLLLVAVVVLMVAKP